MNNNNKDDLLTITNLISEFEEIAEQLNRVGLGFDQGEIDYSGFELALMQLQDCQELLEEILASRREVCSR